MGDISFDMSKSKDFYAFPIAGMALGSVLTIGIAGPNVALPLLAASTLAGGILVPAALMAGIAAVISLFTIPKSLYKIATARVSYERSSYVKDLKNNLGFAFILPLAVGVSSAKAMFVLPLRAIFNKKSNNNPPAPPAAPQGPTPTP